MSLRGQRFELDLEADEFTPLPVSEKPIADQEAPFLVGEIRERASAAAPAPPKPRGSRTGFPEHKKRSAFVQQRDRRDESAESNKTIPIDGENPRAPPKRLMSDREIAHRAGKKHGYDFEARERAEISRENEKKIAEMSNDEVEDARAELMASMSPAMLERLLKRANIDDNVATTRKPPLDSQSSDLDRDNDSGPSKSQQEGSSTLDGATNGPSLDASEPTAPPIHFPIPPRPASDFVPLDPTSPSFTADLQMHYFPDTPHNPSSLSWMQDPTEEDEKESPYNPERGSFATGDLRFSFAGQIITPSQSQEIPVNEGLHHHGQAPSSAGYTIPELSILCRSTLPNQRCIAYQLLGRILFRLGRGDLGPRGSELQEGLWGVIEHQRVVELMMTEANRGGHISAKAYATEALWLWRRGGGGDRGLLKQSERMAK